MAPTAHLLGERRAMGRFKFRIGTKLGLTAGIGVVLVGGILLNQMLGNWSIAESNRLVGINYLNKGNAQATQTAMARAQIDALEIGSASSVTTNSSICSAATRPTPQRNGRRGRSHRMPTARPRNSRMPIWPVP